MDFLRRWVFFFRIMVYLWGFLKWQINKGNLDSSLYTHQSFRMILDFSWSCLRLLSWIIINRKTSEFGTLKTLFCIYFQRESIINLRHWFQVHPFLQSLNRELLILHLKYKAIKHLANFNHSAYSTDMVSSRMKCSELWGAGREESRKQGFYDLFFYLNPPNIINAFYWNCQEWHFYEDIYALGIREGGHESH